MAVASKKTKIKKRVRKITRAQFLDVVDIPKQHSSRRDIARQAVQNIMLPPKMVAQIAEEVAKAVYERVPVPRRAAPAKKTAAERPTGFILDTSAIIDGRIFDLAKIGAFFGNFILLSGVLDELKNIADSKDDAKKERGRRALRNLDDFKRFRGVKLISVADDDVKKPVDERIITYAKKNEGRILTCDFNLSKKSTNNRCRIHRSLRNGEYFKNYGSSGGRVFCKSCSAW